MVTDPASPRCSHYLAARPGNVLQSGAFVKTACVHARHRHFSKAKAFFFSVFSIQGPETFWKTSGKFSFYTSLPPTGRYSCATVAAKYSKDS